MADALKDKPAIPFRRPPGVRLVRVSARTGQRRTLRRASAPALCGIMPASAFSIVEGGLDDPQVIELLQIHLTTARAATAPGSAHALDLSGLKAPEISFWTIWQGERLAGCGALKRLSADHGEVKSMHTAQSLRGTGVGSAMLRHIIAAARARGLHRLSLETGSWDFFRPARALYGRHGFVECPPFPPYVPTRTAFS